MNSQLELTFSQRLAASRLVDATKLSQARAVVGDDDVALAHYLIRQGILTRFQVRQLRAGAKHFRVDKYVVVDYLGRGGNSVVFKARHSLLPGRFVALKTLDCRNVHSSDEALARFRREIDILGSLEHPNVVRAYDVLRTRTQLYLVLEYIEGRDLASLVRARGPLPIPEAVGYAVQAARGLAYAHSREIVHRDLKPANLLLTRDHVVKLCDLGLARFFSLGAAAELTLKGCCLGTPEFMAPEQAEDASVADVRSDIYSLGTTLFHLLTGELPVTGSSHYVRLQRLLTAPPRPLLESRPDAPAELAAVVDGMRARDPSLRPASAEQAIAFLEPFLRDVPLEDTASWDARRKGALVIDILAGNLSMEEAGSRHAISVAELVAWQRRFIEAGEEALDPSTADNGCNPDQLRQLHAKIGAQAMEIEAMRKLLAGVNGHYQQAPA
jgi:serine/threonine-protein kinase